MLSIRSPPRVSFREIPGIVGTDMSKQPATVEKHCAMFANNERSESGLKDSSGDRTLSVGIRHRHLDVSVGPIEDSQSKDDSALEAALVQDNLISEPLTRREMQILKSIVAGQTNKQMARTLCRSQRTIEYHRNRLMRKLNAHNSAELVRQAIAMGIVS